MLKKIWNAWFLKPLTEEQKRWAVLLAVSCERVR
jgi:hypothetical protein